MRLTSSDSSFQLSVLGYQHPDAAGEPYDANWLTIQVNASGPQGAWTGTDSCLLTYEAARLADWLEAASKGTEPARAISFLEPVLLFRLISGENERVLRVHFGNLINPSWRNLEKQPASVNPDLWLDFPLNEVDLAAAAQELRQQIRRYPSRAEV